MIQKINKDDKIELAKKLDYILFSQKITKTQVAHKLGYADGAIVGRWCNEKDLNSNIMTMAQEALERHFNIPMEIWNKEFEYDTKKIDDILNRHKRLFQNTTTQNGLFNKDNKLISRLKGTWYAYLYPSNPASAVKSDGVWIVETIISENYYVIDEYKNEGLLQLGENQSLILKKSHDEGDLTVIRFPNRQVGYGHFRFVIVSNQNNTENEMINFGFYSRKKYTPEVAKKILGSINKMQLKLDLEFNDRMTQEVRI